MRPAGLVTSSLALFRSLAALGGDLQVCEKWLKDRKERTLSAADIAHYQRVVVALNETIRIMGEIDAVIEEYGGWPIQ